MSTSGTPRIRVVAAVISKDDTYLITQRRKTAVLSGLWEFPGGRVEGDESDEEALKRELLERLGATVEVGKAIAKRTHQYEGYGVDLILYEATFPLGDAEPELKKLRVADFRWVRSDEFEHYPFPAADQATTDLLLGVKRG
ncbi:MAG: (deoxy)nucleoside triphosphate pyrophosphohydrolase [Deltaproteobacteria bacterium]|nr:(deoxy)nucleoside triphosphate pyrophosphohydrolase [Deltaproteobacteria bacterium]